MMNLAPWNARSRLALAAASALLLPACAGQPKQVPVGDGIVATDQRTAQALGAPLVSLSTEYEYSSFRRVQTRLRLDDDAYVLVVNVMPDGVARIIFPESPTDDGLLEGRKSYVLPHFFAGYPSLHLQTATSNTHFVVVRRSFDANAVTEGPGYTFALASKTPFNMERLEDKGYFDWVELGRTLWELEPRAVIPIVAEAALASGATFVASAGVARYAGYEQAARPATSYAMRNSFCYADAWSPQWRGFDPWGISQNGCAADELLYRRLSVPPPMLPPRRDSSATDSTATDSTGSGSTPAAVRAAPWTNAFAPVAGPALRLGSRSANEVELNATERRRMLRQERFEGIRNGRERLVDLDRRERRERLMERERSEGARTPRAGGDRGGDGSPRSWERPRPERQATRDESRRAEPRPARSSRSEESPAPVRERAEASDRSSGAAPARAQSEATPRADRVDRQP